MSVEVTITKTGGLFSPANRSYVNDALRDIERRLADEGAQLVRTHLDSVLKHPTGRYSRSIRTRSDSNGSEFTDGGVIYGPWLEGVSSRNQRSRFKGYASFRRARQELDRRAERLIQPDITRLVSRLD